MRTGEGSLEIDDLWSKPSLALIGLSIELKPGNERCEGWETSCGICVESDDFELKLLDELLLFTLFVKISELNKVESVSPELASNILLNTEDCCSSAWEIRRDCSEALGVSLETLCKTKEESVELERYELIDIILREVRTGDRERSLEIDDLWSTSSLAFIGLSIDLKPAGKEICEGWGFSLETSCEICVESDDFELKLLDELLLFTLFVKISELKVESLPPELASNISLIADGCFSSASEIRSGCSEASGISCERYELIDIILRELRTGEGSLEIDDLWSKPSLALIGLSIELKPGNERCEGWETSCGICVESDDFELKLLDELLLFTLFVKISELNKVESVSPELASNILLNTEDCCSSAWEIRRDCSEALGVSLETLCKTKEESVELERYELIDIILREVRTGDRDGSLEIDDLWSTSSLAFIGLSIELKPAGKEICKGWGFSLETSCEICIESDDFELKLLNELLLFTLSVNISELNKVESLPPELASNNSLIADGSLSSNRRVTDNSVVVSALSFETFCWRELELEWVGSLFSDLDDLLLERGEDEIPLDFEDRRSDLRFWIEAIESCDSKFERRSETVSRDSPSVIGFDDDFETEVEESCPVECLKLLLSRDETRPVEFLELLLSRDETRPVECLELLLSRDETRPVECLELLLSRDETRRKDNDDLEFSGDRDFLLVPGDFFLNPNWDIQLPICDKWMGEWVICCLNELNRDHVCVINDRLCKLYDIV